MLFLQGKGKEKGNGEGEGKGDGTCPNTAYYSGSEHPGENPSQDGGSIGRMLVVFFSLTSRGKGREGGRCEKPLAFLPRTSDFMLGM